MVTVEDIQNRIKELQAMKAKPKMDSRYEYSNEYLEGLIEVNQDMLERLLGERH